MTDVADQDYLLNEQYRDASNLNARIELHRRFSTNRYDWQRWVFDHLELPATARVLELGCGPADLWRQNLDRVPPGWDVVLSDMSAGMLEQARANLAAAPPRRFRFELADAQSLPFGDGTFDAVVANHMLYHVPDRSRALGEIRRVLVPGGTLHAATNGQGHMGELFAMVARCVPEAANLSGGAVEFGLENGARQLAPWFPEIQRHDYEDGLVVTEAGPLIAYVLSSRAWGDLAEDDPRLDCFVDLVKAQLAETGRIDITKSTGLFVARRP